MIIDVFLCLSDRKRSPVLRSSKSFQNDSKVYTQVVGALAPRLRVDFFCVEANEVRRDKSFSRRDVQEVLPLELLGQF